MAAPSFWQKRAGSAATAVAGQVQVYFGAIPPLLAHIGAGKLRAFAVTTTSRVVVLPEVPAMDEFLPGYEASGWLGSGAQKSTPPATIDRLAKELAAFHTKPDASSQFWRGAAAHNA